jgi:hypothetical protein
MRSQRTIQERLEQKVFCFGGDGGDGDGAGSGKDDPTRQPGPNTRTDSLGNTVNFNVGPATVDNTPNFTRTLPNGVVVEDYSRPFQGQQNLSSFGSAAPPQNNMYDNLAVNMGTPRPDLGAVATGLSSLNAPAPVTPGQAVDQALGRGQFGGGRLGLGGGFSVGAVPGGYGVQFDTRFAEGGAVTSGIASLGLPQTVLKSTKS